MLWQAHHNKLDFYSILSTNSKHCDYDFTATQYVLLLRYYVTYVLEMAIKLL